MKKLSKHTDYVNILKYSFLFCLFLIFNRLEKSFAPYSAAVFVASITDACSVITSSVLFIAALLLSDGKGLIGSMTILCCFFILLKVVYKKTDTKIKYSFVPFCAIGMLGYVIIGDTLNYVSIEKRILVSIINVVLSLVLTVADRAISKKGIKYKMNYEETLSIAVFFVLSGLGVSNLISPFIWKGIIIFTALIFSYLIGTKSGAFVAAIAGVSLALYYGNTEYVAVALILGLVIDAAMPFSRYFSAIAVIAADYLIYYIFGFYGYYALSDFLPVLIGSAVFIITPTKPLSNLKEKLYAFRERQLARQTINRNRLMLSNRLYELAGVFTEMSCAFSSFKKTQLTTEKAKKTIYDEIRLSACKECVNYMKCKRFEADTENAVYKMIDIGFAKGKISVIDIPLSLTERCSKNQEIIFCMNKMLASYRSYLEGNETVQSGRDLIASEAGGIAEILKGLALESGALLKYQSKLERKLTDELYKNGYRICELLIYGEDERTTIGIILAMNEFNVKEIERIIKKVTSFDMELTDKSNVTEEKCYLSFKKSAPCDAVFGISKRTKDGSETSGDAYSVLRINEDKFLLALSDGMGSGKEAETVSSVSLSLIESFYKAGMSSNLILSTVNKLLSVNTEESFTALDISVIDLNDCSADFIKYGSPYGFIVNDNGVKIIEGNTLPLGILDELKPSVCRTKLNDGDMLLFVTDGISDAFCTSDEIIDFIRKMPALNPQSLADDVVKEAVARNNGEKKDDMTALAVRIFKKKTAV